MGEYFFAFRVFKGVLVRHPLSVLRQVSWDYYVCSFYWSIMTLTGIGYGDITPQNTYERVVVVRAESATWGRSQLLCKFGGTENNLTC